MHAGVVRAQVVMGLKGVYFTATKMTVLDALLRVAPRVVSGVRVTLNRVRAARARESPAAGDADGLRSMFGQLFLGLRRGGWARFRGAAKDAQLWSVDFAGAGYAAPPPPRARSDVRPRCNCGGPRVGRLTWAGPSGSRSRSRART